MVVLVVLAFIVAILVGATSVVASLLADAHERHAEGRGPLSWFFTWGHMEHTRSGARRHDRDLVITVALTTKYLLAEIVGEVLTGSLAILADASGINLHGL